VCLLLRILLNEPDSIFLGHYIIYILKKKTFKKMSVQTFDSDINYISLRGFLRENRKCLNNKTFLFIILAIFYTLS